MQASYAAAFDREMGLTATEFRRCLPEAFEPFALTWLANDHVAVALHSGQALIRWQALAPRVIALISLPRVRVHFAFDGDTHEWLRVMKRFDLVMLRGGG